MEAIEITCYARFGIHHFGIPVITCLEGLVAFVFVIQSRCHNVTAKSASFQGSGEQLVVTGTEEQFVS